MNAAADIRAAIFDRAAPGEPFDRHRQVPRERWTMPARHTDRFQVCVESYADTLLIAPRVGSAVQVEAAALRASLPATRSEHFRTRNQLAAVTDSGRRTVEATVTRIEARAALNTLNQMLLIVDQHLMEVDIPLLNQRLYVDHAWLTAKLTRPEQPVAAVSVERRELNSAERGDGWLQELAAA